MRSTDSVDNVVSVLSDRQVALGMLPLAIEGRPTERDAHLVIRAAIDAGVGLIDTADVYGMKGEPPGYTEGLLRPYTEEVMVATKGGLVREAAGNRRPVGTPEHLRAACEGSVRRLDVEAIDLYQLHRDDPGIPYEESVGAFVELADRGLVRAIGISNATVDQIEIARRVCGKRLVAVQNRLSPLDSVPPDELLAKWGRAGLAMLGYGLFGGVESAASFGSRQKGLMAVATARDVSVHRAAVAWALSLDPAVIPIVGSRRPDSIRDSTAALQLELTEREMARIGESQVRGQG